MLGLVGDIFAVESLRLYFDSVLRTLQWFSLIGFVLILYLFAFDTFDNMIAKTHIGYCSTKSVASILNISHQRIKHTIVLNILS